MKKIFLACIVFTLLAGCANHPKAKSTIHSAKETLTKISGVIETNAETVQENLDELF